MVQSISLAGDWLYPRLDIRCRVITPLQGEADGEDGLQQQFKAEEISLSLSPPPRQLTLASAHGLAAWLDSGGITLLEELSVEARATTAAMECLRELDWIARALRKLEELRGSVRDTLAKAHGNELLEPSIPQLRQALDSFDAERQRLLSAQRGSSQMLRKLHDFLDVPEGIRPILNFDLDQLFDPHRFRLLEQSFSEVVLLNDSFREISKEARA